MSEISCINARNQQRKFDNSESHSHSTETVKKKNEYAYLNELRITSHHGTVELTFTGTLGKGNYK